MKLLLPLPGFYVDGNVDRTLYIFKDVENFRQARSILAYADITCNYIPIADSVYPAMMEAKEATKYEHGPYKSRLNLVSIAE
jgi:hypothetical protein